MRDNSNLFTNIWDMSYGHTKKFQFFDAAKNSKDLVQRLQLQRKIPAHTGCVNSICWNENGKYILSGSDDQKIALVNGYDYSVISSVTTAHHANIFSAKFLPDSCDTHVVSCSGDGIIIFSNLNRPSTSLDNTFSCHRGTAYEVLTLPSDPHSFLSCGEDRTVRWFDLRSKLKCSKQDCKEDILIHCQAPVTSLAVNPLTPYQLAVGCADASVRIFDRRMLCTQGSDLCASNGFQALMTCFTVPEFEQSRRITSLSYSADGGEMLVSYSSDYIYLFDVKDDLEKKPKLLSKDGPSTSNESDDESSLFFRGRPLMKRLRIRGDWSDTGPNARPESEGREAPPETASRNSIVRTMTDILTRMFNNSGATLPRLEPSRSAPAAAHGSSSEDEAVEALEDDIDSDREQDNRRTEIILVNDLQPERSTAPRIPFTRKEALEVENMSTASNISTLPGTSRDAQNVEPPHESTERLAENVPSITSSAFENKKESSNVGVNINEPSTSQTLTSAEKDLSLDKCDNNPSSSGQRTSDTSGLNYESIEQTLESRRKDLVDKHHTEPMVNFHYSGQSASSGIITMDVVNSTTPNETQWLEQTASDLPELPPSVYNYETSHDIPPPAMPQTHQPTSSDSETEAAVQTIQPNENRPTLVGGPSQSLTFTERADTADEEMELMVEVDSCSWDSEEVDEDNPRRTRGASDHRTRRCDKHSDDFMCSLNEKVKAANDELKKEKVNLQNVTQPRVKRKYTGHRNARTMIKESTFWGDNFIMSGSDCGHIFIWDRFTTELVMLMEADHHVVNCLQPHPYDPILASSGIDYDIKLWAPTRDEPQFDVEKANEIIKRNKVMLEETKDTITVPASFMFRMFTSLSNFRTGRAYRWSRAAREMRAARERENEDASRR